MKKKFKLLISNKIRLIIFIALIVVTIIPTYVIPKVKWNNANILERGVVCVRGTSMEPTIKDNTVMYVDDLSFNRGDVVAVKNHSTLKYEVGDKKTLLKRIVGLPGETVEITADGVLINGELLNEDYTDTQNKTLQDNNDIQEVVLSYNEYFVLGDNREKSFDSRHIGAINKSDFLYKLTEKENDYTKRIHKKNLITSIVILVITILTPVLYFFLCTLSFKKEKLPNPVKTSNKLKRKTKSK